MANVQFRIGKKIVDGKCELFVRFYASRTIYARGRSYIYVSPDMWNEDAERLIIPKRNVSAAIIDANTAQAQIDGLRSAILNAYMTQRDGRFDGAWLDSVVRAFHGMIPNATTRARIVDKIPEYVAAKKIFPDTAKHYDVLSGDITRFESANRVRLYADDVTPDDVESFAAFLRTETKRDKHGKQVKINRCENTINERLRKLRAVCRWLVKNGDLAKNPFDVFTISEDVYGTPLSLTIDERDALYAYQYQTPFEDLTMHRDIFVFQCHVGCRVSDLINLRRENITDDGMLQYIQHKLRRSNPQTIRVPLDDVAMEIVNRYAGKDVNGRLFPCYAPQKYNEKIKQALRIAGIRRIVLVQDKLTYEPVPTPICEIASSHLARKTFVSNMMKYVRDRMIVSSFTGHAADSSSFKRYANIDDELKTDILSAFEKRNESKRVNPNPDDTK